jgi:ribulose-phosphate 3-epimerase
VPVPRTPSRIAPSILAADFGRLAEEVQSAARAGADLLHVDVMDGHFVPNLTIGPGVVAAIRKATTLPLDVHLMISEPVRYAREFVAAGADSLSIHQETCSDLPAAIDAVRAAGAREVAVAINPETPVESVTDVLPQIDMLLVMSVHPGFGGQSFIEAALDKIRTAAALRRRLGARFAIEVDGGITVENAARAAAAGADVLVAGTAIFRQPDYGRVITAMRRAAEDAIAAA